MPQPSRDRDVFLAMQAALVATNEFDVVPLHRDIEHVRASDEARVVASFQRTNWAEENIAEGCLIRTVQFDLTIALRVEDEVDSFEAKERLENIAKNTIGGQSFASITFLESTWLRAGADDLSARHPEARSTLTGQFAYVLNGFADNNTTP